MAINLASALMGAQAPSAKAEAPVKGKTGSPTLNEEAAYGTVFQTMFGLLAEQESTPLALFWEMGDVSLPQTEASGIQEGTTNSSNSLKKPSKTGKVVLPVSGKKSKGQENVDAQSKASKQEAFVLGQPDARPGADEKGSVVVAGGKVQSEKSKNQKTRSVFEAEAAKGKGPGSVQATETLKVSPKGSIEAVVKGQAGKAVPQDRPVIQSEVGIKESAQTPQVKNVQVSQAASDEVKGSESKSLGEGVTIQKIEKGIFSRSVTQPSDSPSQAKAPTVSDPHQAVRAFHKQTAEELSTEPSRPEQGQAKTGLDAMLEAGGEKAAKVTVPTPAVESTAKTGEPAPVVLRDAVVEQVRPALTQLIRRGDSRMTLMLKPESLGPMQIEVETTKGLVEVRFLVETTEVKTLVDQALPELKAALGREGVETSGLDVNVASDLAAQSDGRRHQSRESARRQARNGSLQEVSVSEEESEPTVRRSRRFGYNSMELVA